jgi:hypothetical protein
MSLWLIESISARFYVTLWRKQACLCLNRPGIGRWAYSWPGRSRGIVGETVVLHVKQNQATVGREQGTNKNARWTERE